MSEGNRKWFALNLKPSQFSIEKIEETKHKVTLCPEAKAALQYVMEQEGPDFYPEIFYDDSGMDIYFPIEYLDVVTEIIESMFPKNLN